MFYFLSLFIYSGQCAGGWGGRDAHAGAGTSGGEAERKRIRSRLHPVSAEPTGPEHAIHEIRA